MSGFQRKPLVLEWPERHDLHGLRVLCRRPRIEQIDNVEAAMEEVADGEKDARKLMHLMRETIGKALISWNYRDEADEVVAADPDGFASIDIEVQLEILGAWAAKGVAVPKSLGKESDSGHSSPVRLSDGIPTVVNPTLSNALANLHVHSAISPSSNDSPVTP